MILKQLVSSALGAVTGVQTLTTVTLYGTVIGVSAGIVDPS